jgi:hypothetical protein
VNRFIVEILYDDQLQDIVDMTVPIGTANSCEAFDLEPLFAMLTNAGSQEQTLTRPLLILAMKEIQGNAVLPTRPDELIRLMGG